MNFEFKFEFGSIEYLISGDITSTGLSIDYINAQAEELSDLDITDIKLENKESVEKMINEHIIHMPSDNFYVIDNEGTVQLFSYALSVVSNLFTSLYMNKADNLFDNEIYFKILHIGLNDNSNDDDVISFLGFDRNNVSYMLFVKTSMAKKIFDIDFSDESIIRNGCLYKCIGIEDYKLIDDPEIQNYIPLWLKNIFKGKDKDIKKLADEYGFVPLWLSSTDGVIIDEAPAPTFNGVDIDDLFLSIKEDGVKIISDN